MSGCQCVYHMYACTVKPDWQMHYISIMKMLVNYGSQNRLSSFSSLLLLDTVDNNTDLTIYVTPIYNDVCSNIIIIEKMNR